MNEDNRQLAIRWFEEVWNIRRDAVVDEMMAPDSVGHMEGMEVIGPDAFKTARNTLITAIPNLRVVVEATASEGEVVVVRWRAAGNHRGLGFGFSPTGAAVTFSGLTWLQFKAGQLVEGWDSWNQGALMESLRAAELAN